VEGMQLLVTFTMSGRSLVTAAWHILWLQMEEKTSRHGECLGIYSISNHRQLTKGGLSDFGCVCGGGSNKSIL
jgi:hypothetical protein